MSAQLESLLTAQQRADAQRWDDLQRQGINVPAIVEAREGMVGDELADFWIESARRQAARILPDLPGATEQRLQFRIGVLESYLRDACERLESAVRPAGGA